MRNNTMKSFGWARHIATLLWRGAVLALLLWNLHELRETRRAADEAREQASVAVQAVDELSNLIDEALGADDDAPAGQGT
jgi:hypothetical protein